MPEPALLSPDRTADLVEFARAVKAAARLVALYPPTHPAIQQGLARVGQASTELRGDGAVTITVLPHTLQVDGRTIERPDRALVDLAELLHEHLVGELTVSAALSPKAWHAFLKLLARPAVEVRNEGGLARAWEAAGGSGLEIRLIDYADVLREREGGAASDWSRIVTAYLESDLSDLDRQQLYALLDVADDPAKLAAFTERLSREGQREGVARHVDLVSRVLQVLADFIARTRPEQLDAVLQQITGAVPQLLPESVTTLVSDAGAVPGGQLALGAEVRARVSDEQAAGFVAASIARDHGATARLVTAFEALIPEPTRRGRTLELAAHTLGKSSIGQQPDFPDLWKHAQAMLTSYSDAAYVSREYGRELPAARARAEDVERAGDDPPDRIGRWLSSVANDELRRLDQQLLVDLLRIETRPTPWEQVLTTAGERVNDLALMGDLGTAQSLLEAIVATARSPTPLAARAEQELASLRSGPLVKHVVLFVRQARDADVRRATAFCAALGAEVIPALIKALEDEQSSTVVRRLREVLLGFGAAGRPYLDALCASPNPAVRRTAIDLLRAAGGVHGLSGLNALLDDPDPQVQREAIRALAQSGTGAAYAALERALHSGAPRTRDAVVQTLVTSRDDRAVPLLVYIVRQTPRRGPLHGILLQAVEALGKVAGSNREAIDLLSQVLGSGDWWAPLRTRRLRETAARALRDAGSPAARAVLETAHRNGSPGVRRAARLALLPSAADASR